MKLPEAEPSPHALRAVSAGYLGLLRKSNLKTEVFKLSYKVPAWQSHGV